MLAIIPNKKIYLTLSATLVALSVVSLTLWGLKFGIDFKGGSLIEVEFTGEARPASSDVIKALADFNLGLVIQPTGQRGLVMRFHEVDENVHQAILGVLKILGPVTEKRFESIGPTIGQELQKKAIKAIFLVLVLIVVYIAWAFRKISRPVSSWKYGLTAITALVHDVTIPTGVFSVLGHFYGVEVDAFFVTALLTILGFSVHDTIVVFDRIRENLRHYPGQDFVITINNSVNETIARSINTSLTVLLVLLAVFFLGGQTTKNLALALILGVFFGTYSSIFVASPLLTYWRRRL